MISSQYLRHSNKLLNTIRIGLLSYHNKVNGNTITETSDTFGTLDSSKLYSKLDSEYLTDDDDGYDQLEIKRGFKINPIGYKILLTRLIHRSKPIRLTEALEAYHRMTTEDRIPPSTPMYTLMISGCAKCGYTKKAFEFFDELLRYELRPTKATVTALFNACAQCPQTDAQFAIKRAYELRQYLLSDGYVYQQSQYHSMVKAFAKLGEMNTAYQIVDEMIANGHPTTPQTYAMLLMGCISNQSSGLYHTIKIIRKMKYHSINFNIYIYNLLLRAIRDCNIGDEHNLENIIREWNRIPKFSKFSQNRSNNFIDIYQMLNKSSDEIQNKLAINSMVNDKSLSLTNVTNVPNVLYFNSSNSGKVIEVDRESLNKAENRLMLFGGMKGYLQMMEKDCITPDIRTFTLILDLINYDTNSRQELFEYIDKNNVKLDTDFFNILIKKCNQKVGIREGKQILLMMQKRNLEPNIMTFGVLAIGCTSFSLARQLIEDMDRNGFRANIEIIGALVHCAARIKNINYLNYIINYMKYNEIEPNSLVIERIEAVKTDVQQKLANFDRFQDNDLPDEYKTERFRSVFAKFKSNYELWLQKINVQQEEHPWKQFQFDKTVGLQKFHDFKMFMRRKIDLKNQYLNKTN